MRSRASRVTSGTMLVTWGTAGRRLRVMCCTAGGMAAPTLVFPCRVEGETTRPGCTATLTAGDLPVRMLAGAPCTATRLCFCCKLTPPCGCEFAAMLLVICTIASAWLAFCTDGCAHGMPCSKVTVVSTAPVPAAAVLAAAAGLSLRASRQAAAMAAAAPASQRSVRAASRPARLRRR